MSLRKVNARVGHIISVISAVSIAFASTVPAANAAPSIPVADASADTQVLPWTEMGPWGPETKSFPDVMVRQGLTGDFSPIGTNTACVPQPGENPVVLIHGMNSNAFQTYARMAPELKSMGKCLYAFNVGKLGPDERAVLGKIPTFYNMTALDTALGELTAKIEKIKAETGADAVDIVGHSAGGALAAAYAKQQQGHGVGTVVTLAGVLHGTSLLGVSYALEDLNRYNGAGDKAAGYVVSPSLVDLMKHSQFMAKLEDGGMEVPGVRYVSITTQLDEAVTPIESGQWTAPQATNIVLQNGCSVDLSGHIGLTYSPRAIAHVANALGRNVSVPCEPVTGLVDGGINNNRDMRPQTLDGISNGITAVDARIASARK